MSTLALQYDDRFSWDETTQETFWGDETPDDEEEEGLLATLAVTVVWLAMNIIKWVRK